MLWRISLESWRRRSRINQINLIKLIRKKKMLRNNFKWTVLKKIKLLRTWIPKQRFISSTWWTPWTIIKNKTSGSRQSTWSLRKCKLKNLLNFKTSPPKSTKSYQKWKTNLVTYKHKETLINPNSLKLKTYTNNWIHKSNKIN